eukprot:1138350-Pelagomonas_calceolata.AAC.1
MHKNLRAEEPPAVLEQLPDLIHSCLSWSSWKLLGMPPAGQSDPAGQPADKGKGSTSLPLNA